MKTPRNSLEESLVPETTTAKAAVERDTFATPDRTGREDANAELAFGMEVEAEVETELLSGALNIRREPVEEVAEAPAAATAEVKSTQAEKEAPAVETFSASSAAVSEPAPAKAAKTVPDAPHQTIVSGPEIASETGLTLDPQATVFGVSKPHIDGDNLEDLMAQLNHSGKSWFDVAPHTGITLRVGFPQSLSDLPEDHQEAYGDPALEGLTPFAAFNWLQQQHAEEALTRWSDVADIEFVVVDPGEEADIFFIGREYPSGPKDPEDPDGEQYPGVGGYSSGIDEDNGSVIRINTDSSGWVTMQPGGKGFQTLIHEIGHSLGISHPGHYDIGDGAKYETHAEYVEDSRMYSVMSYFGTGETGASLGGLKAQLETIRSHDMYVIQELYGANWNTRTGDTTYGFNATADVAGGTFDFDALATENAFFDLFAPDYQERGPIFTIWDAGGNNDTLDTSGDDRDATLDLRPGEFSSTHGMTYNISIAHQPGDAMPAGRNVMIENAVSGAGDDVLIGNEANNVLEGGDGDDTLVGSGGADQMNGGAGTDQVSYAAFSDDVEVDLGVGGLGVADKPDGWDLLLSIEDVVTGAGDDEIIGSEVDNRIEAGFGDDTVLGEDGDDTVVGGDGRDEIRGGQGDDDLTGGMSLPGLNLIGDHDTIYGGAGDDVLRGETGDDYLYGGDDDDTIDGGDGDDWISGGGGLDALNGGDGIDTADYRYSGDDWYVDLGIANLSVGYANNIAHGIENMSNFERVRMGGGDDTISGSEGADGIWGGGGHDEIDGDDGADTLIGQAGNDTIRGGEGADFINGGSGADTASYIGASSGVAVDLAIGGVQATGGAGADRLISIERLIGSEHGDILSGDGGVNWLNGGEGGDLLFGRDGHDWLRGEDGGDILEGGEGNDILNGGDGRDAASYFFADSGVWVNLGAVGSQDTRGAGFDVLYDIEDVIGSFHADILTGDDGDNRLTAGAGDDILNGGAGGDTLDAGSGNDVLIGGTGVDVIDGGDGVDWAFYTTPGPSGVTVDLTKGWQYTGAGGTDLIVNVENVLGSTGADELAGDEAANELRGGGGDDTLFGRGGDDTLEGGTGDDKIYVGATGPLQNPDDIVLAPIPEDPETDPTDTIVFASFGDDAPVYQSYSAMTASAPSGGAFKTVAAGGDANTPYQSIGKFEIDPGSGDDTVVFRSGWGDDEVFGYNAQYDTLDFTGVGGLTSHFQFDVEDTEDGALVSFGENSVLLHDVLVANLEVDQFLI